jgi:hypothetical protein
VYRKDTVFEVRAEHPQARESRGSTSLRELRERWAGSVALLAGSAIGGVLGAIMTIPLAGALRVLSLRVLAPAVRRWSGAEPAVAGIPPVDA